MSHIYHASNNVTQPANSSSTIYTGVKSPHNINKKNIMDRLNNPDTRRSEYTTNNTLKPNSTNLKRKFDSTLTNVEHNNNMDTRGFMSRTFYTANIPVQRVSDRSHNISYAQLYSQNNHGQLTSTIENQLPHSRIHVIKNINTTSKYYMPKVEHNTASTDKHMIIN